jgi:hypothetical protein
MAEMPGTPVNYGAKHQPTHAFSVEQYLEQKQRRRLVLECCRCGTEVKMSL